MKKMLFIMASLLLTLNACSSKPQVATFNDLPAPAQQFITTYFAQSDIAWIQWERDGVSKEYEVKLNDGTWIEFYGDGALEKIECKPNAVPAGIVPAPVIAYMNTNFPQAVVVKYHIDRRDQEVELNTGLELVFDLNGNFLKIDD
ncbi:MAG: PepSY-like domain-containing protein [Paludibacteraceae bacterium]